MSKKESEAAGKIKKYLEQQNRPYSLNDVFLNLHKELGKTAVQKALEQLVAEGSVLEKTYGKQKVYVYNQELFPPLDESHLRKMDNQVAELTTSVKEKETELSDADAQLRTLSSSLTTEEAEKKVAELEDEVSKLQQKLHNLRENQVLVPKDERDKVNQENEQMIKHWRKRKRTALDILDAILEGYPHPKKQLYEEIGVETDEEVGVQLPKT